MNNSAQHTSNEANNNEAPVKTNGIDLPDAILRYLKQFGELHNDNRSANLSFAYDMGTIIINAQIEMKHIAEKSKHKEITAKRLTRYFAEAHNFCERTVENYVRFARAFDKEGVQELCATDGLSWTHVVHILSVPNTKVRAELISCVGQHQWSVSQLQLEIEGKKITGKKRGPGRPVKLPLGIGQAVDWLRKRTTTLSSCLKVMSSCEEFDLARQISDCDPREYTRQWKPEIEDTAVTCRKLADNLVHFADTIQSAQNQTDTSSSSTVDSQLKSKGAQRQVHPNY
jgi:hypothetical protein